MAVAEVVKSSTSGGFKRLKLDGTPAKKPGPKKGSKKKPVAKGKPGSKKGSSIKPDLASSSSAAIVAGMPEVSAEKAAAAHKARNALGETVSQLPHKVSETHIVRSFGRIKPEWHNSLGSPLDALYSSPHAIYPVGFSCDRLEFSPIHGRVIRIRCDILDGNTLRAGREQKIKEEKKIKAEGGEPMLVDEKFPGEKNMEDLGNGPVFRVTWGEGVEEKKDPSCPFDPYVASANLGGDVDAIAVPLSSNSKGGKPAGLPEVGMRVSVRFDKGKVHGGAIAKVSPIEKKAKGKNKKALCEITIQYDDGVTEVTAFPDPDIVVAYQGG